MFPNVNFVTFFPKKEYHFRDQERITEWYICGRSLAKFITTIYCRKYKEIYTNQVNQVLSGYFFQCFQWELGAGISKFFQIPITRL